MSVLNLKKKALEIALSIQWKTVLTGEDGIATRKEARTKRFHGIITMSPDYKFAATIFDTTKPQNTLSSTMIRVKMNKAQSWIEAETEATTEMAIKEVDLDEKESKN